MTKLNFCRWNLVPVVLVSLFASALLAAGGYHQVKRISIPGDTGWDYITADTAGRRLYVPHGTEVVVINLDSGAIVGSITGQRGTHGVAVAPEFGHGFIDATDPGSVTMFDLKTLAVLNKERVGDDPNGIIYDPKTKRVYSADRGSKRLTMCARATSARKARSASGPAITRATCATSRYSTSRRSITATTPSCSAARRSARPTSRRATAP